MTVVGYYEKIPWPDTVARNVGFAVATLQCRLKTFELRCGAKWHDLNAHHDFNKPSCPGAAITEQFYVHACLDAAAQLDEAGQVKALSVHPKLLGAWQLSGGVWLKGSADAGPTDCASVRGESWHALPGARTRRSAVERRWRRIQPDAWERDGIGGGTPSRSHAVGGRSG